MVVSRVIGLLATMPLFGERNVPWQTKAGVSMIIGFLLLPLADHSALPPTDSILALGLAICQELLVGILIGYLARLLFGAFQFAINALDFQMGLSFIQLVSPGSGASLSVLGQLLNTLMLLLFLELDGHHILLRALGATVAAVPLGTSFPSPAMAEGIISLFSYFVVASFQIALPTVTVLLLIDVAMGVIGKVVPQLNVFLVSLPVKIMVGLMVLSLTLPSLAEVLGVLLGRLQGDIGLLLQAWR
jgi:flagellar biosynthetic protein FliR